jgi:mannose-6-phosphate isomerase-like protein (cupin superfamily)
VIVHVTGDETDGRFCVVEFLQPPGEWSPLHVHKGSDQTQFVLEGELTVYLPGRAVVIGPGECINTPMNVPHTECVTSAQHARVLDVNAPAGFDEFIAEGGKPTTGLTLRPVSEPPDIPRLTRACGQVRHRATRAARRAAVAQVPLGAGSRVMHRVSPDMEKPRKTGLFCSRACKPDSSPHARQVCVIWLSHAVSAATFEP